MQRRTRDPQSQRLAEKELALCRCAAIKTILGLINGKHLFLIVLGDSRTSDAVSGETFLAQPPVCWGIPGPQTRCLVRPFWLSPLCAHVVVEVREFCGVSFVRILIPSLGLLLHGLITPKTYLLVPASLGSRIPTFELSCGDTDIQTVARNQKA